MASAWTSRRVLLTAIRASQRSTCYNSYARVFNPSCSRSLSTSALKSSQFHSKTIRVVAGIVAVGGFTAWSFYSLSAEVQTQESRIDGLKCA